VVIRGVVLTIALIYVLINLVVDLPTGAGSPLGPKVRRDMTSTVTTRRRRPPSSSDSAAPRAANLLLRRISRNQLLVSGGVIFAFMLLAAVLVPISWGRTRFR